MVSVLLDHASCPADDILRAVDAQGNTPLHIAAGHGDMKGKPEDRMRAQEAMMRALLPPVRGRREEGSEKRDSAPGLSLGPKKHSWRHPEAAEGGEVGEVVAGLRGSPVIRGGRGGTEKEKRGGHGSR